MSNSTVSFVPSSFHVADYVVFALFLLLSGSVGVFFSLRGQMDTQDYFLGGRNMRPLPVGISLGVSFMSAASIIGLPAESYIHGYPFMLSVVSMCVGFFCGGALIVGVLHRLSVTSISEYLKLRYRSPLVTFSTNVMVLLCIFEYMGVCMVGSVIAFSSATGGAVSVEAALAVGGAVGIFYTAVGGMKAVVWSDALQFVFMIAGIAAVTIGSILDTPGGMKEIVRLGDKFGRFPAPNWSVDLTARHTVWGLVVGFFCVCASWSVQPAIVQRLCCTRSRRDALTVTAIGMLIFALVTLLPMWAGLNIFGFYASRGCDVHAAGWVKDNEIVMYYVRERLGFPGFQGMFVASLYAGSLSSLSSGLNAASSILWSDTIAPMLKRPVSAARAALVSKLIVVVFGVLSMLWCFALHKIGGLVMQLSYSIDASMYGAYFGVVLLSVFVGHANWKAALVGMVVSFVVTLSVGTAALMSRNATGQKLPSVIDNCARNGSDFLSNVTNAAPLSNNSALDGAGLSLLQPLASISYEWFSPLCLAVSMVTSLLVIGCTGPKEVSVGDRRMAVSCCRLGCGHREDSCGDAEELNMLGVHGLRK